MQLQSGRHSFPSFLPSSSSFFLSFFPFLFFSFVRAGDKSVVERRARRFSSARDLRLAFALWRDRQPSNRSASNGTVSCHSLTHSLSLSVFRTAGHMLWADSEQEKEKEREKETEREKRITTLAIRGTSSARRGDLQRNLIRNVECRPCLDLTRFDSPIPRTADAGQSTRPRGRGGRMGGHTHGARRGHPAADFPAAIAALLRSALACSGLLCSVARQLQSPGHRMSGHIYIAEVESPPVAGAAFPTNCGPRPPPGSHSGGSAGCERTWLDGLAGRDRRLKIRPKCGLPIHVPEDAGGVLHLPRTPANRGLGTAGGKWCAAEEFFFFPSLPCVHMCDQRMDVCDCTPITDLNGRPGTGPRARANDAMRCGFPTAAAQAQRHGTETRPA